jgi:hypothetical protein
MALTLYTRLRIDLFPTDWLSTLFINSP